MASRPAVNKMDEKEFFEYLEKRQTPRYERVHFDAFLNKVGFSFNLPAIHITGTNGKGATLNYLISIYQCAGYRVGSYHSPYFYKPNEMTKIDDEEIDSGYMISLFEKYRKQIESFDLSSFEILTFVAFSYFNEKKPDICVIEVGMGGEIDATNIFEPILSIITSVSLEHTGALGRTVSEIARSKGGIIKSYVPVLVGNIPDSADITLKEIARKKESPYHFVSRHHFVQTSNSGIDFAYGEYLNLHLNSHALYQVKNASLAVEAVTLLQADFPVSEEAIRKGLAYGEIPLHVETIDNFILDGAHNPEAFESLVSDLARLEKDKPIHALFACFRDKNINVELPLLGTYVSDITLTSFDHKRARTEEEYFLYIGEYAYNGDWKKALELLMSAYPNDYILVTGSIAFAALVRKYILEYLRK